MTIHSTLPVQGILQEENMAERAAELGAYFRESLTRLNSPHLKTIRGKGLLNAIVVQQTDKKEAAWELCLLLKDNGLLAKPTHGDKIRFAPPLVITREQIDECVEIIDRCLQQL